MALINCPECGKEISDKAQNCIHCGCPIAQVNEPEKKIDFKKPNIDIGGIKDKVKEIVAKIGPKKLGIIAVVIAVIIVITSLPSSGGLNVMAKNIELNEVHQISGVGELEIYRVATTNHLLEDDISNKTHVAFECYFTNKTGESYPISELATISAKSKKTGTVYGNGEVGELGYGDVFDVVAEPNVKTKVAFALEISEDESDLVVTLSFGKKELNFKYTVGDLIRNTVSITKGSSIEVEDVAAIEITDIVYSEGVWAPNPYSGKTHRGYSVDDANETAFLILDTMYTNLMHINQGPGSIFVGAGPVKIEAVYQDKYYYTSELFYNFSYSGKYVNEARRDEDYIPNSKVRTCMVIEVPRNMVEEELKITMRVGDKEFTYKGKPSYVKQYGMK